MPGRKINEKMSKKLVGLFLAVILALVAVAVRITYINATSGEQYERIVLSQNQQQYESRMIPFKRGDIVDAERHDSGYQREGLQCNTWTAMW